MALLYRKKVRDAVLGLLSANFNTVMEATATVYGVDPVVIDFTPGSPTFAVSHIDPSNVEKCQFLQYPAACLYTSDVVDMGSPKQWEFSGKVMAHIDFYVRDREGVEGSNTEDLFDAIEDAVLQVLNSPANAWPAGVVFARNTQASRQTLIPLADGYATQIPIGSLFEVFIQ